MMSFPIIKDYELIISFYSEIEISYLP